MIDLQSVGYFYPTYEISIVGFIRGRNNPADGLTKIGNCLAVDHMLGTGKADFDVDQSVIRNNSSLPNCIQNISRKILMKFRQ